jgi:hypothetical protein
MSKITGRGHVDKRNMIEHEVVFLGIGIGTGLRPFA